MSHTKRRARELQHKHRQRQDWEGSFKAALDACPDEQARWLLLARAERDLYGYVNLTGPHYLYQIGLERTPFYTAFPDFGMPPVIRRNRL